MFLIVYTELMLLNNCAFDTGSSARGTSAGQPEHAVYVAGQRAVEGVYHPLMKIVSQQCQYEIFKTTLFYAPVILIRLCSWRWLRTGTASWYETSKHVHEILRLRHLLDIDCCRTCARIVTGYELTNLQVACQWGQIDLTRMWLAWFWDGLDN